MAPYTLAFKRPGPEDTFHPGPWKAARGGFFLDVEVEVALDAGVQPVGFDRLNTLWWVLALLRLTTASKLHMPFVSNICLNEVVASEVEPVFWPLEAVPRRLFRQPNPPYVLTENDLNWLHRAFEGGASLMREERFNRAFQAFDDATWAHSTGSALVTIWGAMETLIRPGRREITKILASTLAAFLEPPGPERDRVFQKIGSLYQVRGQFVHASQPPEITQLQGSVDIGRRTLMACLERQLLPDIDELQAAWKERR